MDVATPHPPETAFSLSRSSPTDGAPTIGRRRTAAPPSSSSSILGHIPSGSSHSAVTAASTSSSGGPPNHVTVAVGGGAGGAFHHPTTSSSGTAATTTTAAGRGRPSSATNARPISAGITSLPRHGHGGAPIVPTSTTTTASGGASSNAATSAGSPTATSLLLGKNSLRKPAAVELLGQLRNHYADIDTSRFHGLRDEETALQVIAQLPEADLRAVASKLLRALCLARMPVLEDEASGDFFSMTGTSDADRFGSHNQHNFSGRQGEGGGGGGGSHSTTATTPSYERGAPMEAAESSHVSRYSSNGAMLGMSRTISLASMGGASIASLASRVPARSTHHLHKSTDEDTGQKTVNQYVILSEIGRGTQGKVKLAFDNNKNELRAVKVVKRPAAAVGSAKNRLDQHRRLQRLEKEIAVMKRLRHRNIVSLFEVIDDPSANKLYLVMQYVPRGSLATTSGSANGLFCNRRIPLDRMPFIARQLCAGLTYLHLHGIVHRDIKPENLLLGEGDQVFIGDFGVSDMLLGAVEEQEESPIGSAGGAGGGRRGTALIKDPRVSGGFGTPAFFAPEMVAIHTGDRTPNTPTLLADIITGASPSPAAAAAPHSGGGSTTSSQHSTPQRADRHRLNGFALDIWALGVTMFMMLTGRLPWYSVRADDGGPELSLPTYFDHILTQPPMFPPQPLLLQHRTQEMDQCAFSELTEPLPAPWAALITDMLNRDPRKRPTIVEVRTRVKNIHRVGGSSNNKTQPSPSSARGKYSSRKAAPPVQSSPQHQTQHELASFEDPDTATRHTSRRRAPENEEEDADDGGDSDSSPHDGSQISVTEDEVGMAITRVSNVDADFSGSRSPLDSARTTLERLDSSSMRPAPRASSSTTRVPESRANTAVFANLPPHM